MNCRLLLFLLQLLHYYIYAVHAFFVEEGGQGETSESLRQFIQDIQTTLIRREVAAAAAGSELAAAGDSGQQQQQLRQLVGLVSVPEISPVVALSRSA